MHVLHPLGFRTIGIRLFQVEIFGDLFQDTHKKNCIVKIQFSIEKVVCNLRSGIDAVLIQFF